MFRATMKLVLNDTVWRLVCNYGSMHGTRTQAACQQHPLDIDFARIQKLRVYVIACLIMHYHLKYKQQYHEVLRWISADVCMAGGGR